MSEEKKKPRVIHVDNLIIKANEVTFQQEPREDRQPNFHSPNFQAPSFQPPFQRPGFQNQGDGEGRPVQRDFWGFPIPQSPQSPQSVDSGEQPVTNEKEADSQTPAEDN